MLENRLDNAKALVQRIRLRMLGLLLGLALVAIATISLTTIPAWPVVGVAVATVAVCINRVAARLNLDNCLGCGGSLRGHEPGAYGIVCPRCGSMNQRLPAGDEAVPPEDDLA